MHVYLNYYIKFSFANMKKKILSGKYKNDKSIISRIKINSTS